MCTHRITKKSKRMIADPGYVQKKKKSRSLAPISESGQKYLPHRLGYIVPALDFADLVPACGKTQCICGLGLSTWRSVRLRSKLL